MAYPHVYPELAGTITNLCRTYNWSAVSCIMAQMATESTNGQSQLSGKYYNFGGWKAKEGQKSVTMSTHEVVNGRTITIQAKFRAFDSLDEGLKTYISWMATGRYKGASKLNDPDQYSKYLHDMSYFTASPTSYAAALKTHIKLGNLTQYDNPNTQWDNYDGTTSDAANTSESSGGSGTLYNTRYKREDGIAREFAYIDSKYQASLKKSKLKLSILNYTDLLLDVAQTQGWLTEGTMNTSSSDSENVTVGGTSGPLQGKSGKSLSVKKTINIPINNCIIHSGDDGTDYSYWAGKMGWTQGRVGKEWLNRNQPHLGTHGCGTLDGHCTIAMRPIMGNAGDLVKVHCEDGTTFTAVLADIKGSDATSTYGHVKGSDVSPCEWYYYGGDTGHNDGGRSFDGCGNLKGKRVVKVENFGSWIDN